MLKFIFIYPIKPTNFTRQYFAFSKCRDEKLKSQIFVCSATHRVIRRDVNFNFYSELFDVLNMGDVFEILCQRQDLYIITKASFEGEMLYD